MANDAIGKQYLIESRKRAEALLEEAHHAVEVKNVIEDLLHVCSTFENAAQNSAGTSSDVRVLKKKMDQMKGEMRTAEGKTESLKAAIVALTTELKTISAETAAILKRFEATPADPNHANATKIKAATQKMAEVIIKSSQA